MDTYMHKTMVSIVSLEKIEIIRSQEFMPSEGRLKFLKKMIILGPKTAILGPQFCRILVLGPHFWWSGRAWASGPPWICPCRAHKNLHAPLKYVCETCGNTFPYKSTLKIHHCVHTSQCLFCCFAGSCIK